MSVADSVRKVLQEEEQIDEISSKKKHSYLQKVASTESQSRAAGDLYWNAHNPPYRVGEAKKKHAKHFEFAKRVFKKLKDENAKKKLKESQDLSELNDTAKAAITKRRTKVIINPPLKEASVSGEQINRIPAVQKKNNDPSDAVSDRQGTINDPKSSIELRDLAYKLVLAARGD